MPDWSHRDERTHPDRTASSRAVDGGRVRTVATCISSVATFSSLVASSVDAVRALPAGSVRQPERHHSTVVYGEASQPSAVARAFRDRNL